MESLVYGRGFFISKTDEKNTSESYPDAAAWHYSFRRPVMLT